MGRKQVTETGVLFVDDEPNVLKGIRRMLRHKRGVWKMHFAGGGREALELMAREHIDIVVTDMRMPEMDGATLLEAVQKAFPDTARFVLSGQCDEETALRAVSVSHQYLSKPCDADELVGKLDRALAERTKLSTEPLRSLMSSLGSVPSRPSVYADLTMELESPQVSADRIDQIVARDPGLAAKLLQICNSSYFGLASQVRSIHQAVSFLGVDTVKALALKFGVLSQLKRDTVGDCGVCEIIERCLETAILARVIVRDAGMDQIAQDEAYVAGLMLDIGILVLADNLDCRYDAVLKDHIRHGDALVRAERELLGADHAAVAAYLLGGWGLPPSIVRALELHHRPDLQETATMNTPLAVCLASLLVEEAAWAVPDVPVDGSLIPEDIRAIPSVAERLEAWCEALGKLKAG